MTKKIYIHGASSYLGRSFIKKLLEQNTKVNIFARRTSDLSFLNEKKYENLIDIKFYDLSLNELFQNYQKGTPSDGVFFDFAWFGVFNEYRNSPKQLTINIPLIISSIELAKIYGVKHWVGFGSQAEYGSKDHQICEEELCTPSTIYGKSKLICSQIAKEICELYNIEFSWLRLFSSYGPDDNHEWLIPYLIKEMLNNNEINVTKGEQMWDYLFIDDISEVLLKMVNAKGIGIANLGSGQCIEIKQLIEKIKKLTHSDSKINYGAIEYRPDQVMFMWANNSKIANHLNWQPKINIDEGLKKTINFLKNNK